MNFSTRTLAISGLLGAISIVLGATGLGFIPVPTPAGHATILHIPVILGGVIEGPLVGLATGLIFGIFSFMQGASFFVDPLVAILPRLFIGVTAFYSYRSLKGTNREFALAVAGVIGSLTNTFLVLGMAVLRGYLPLAGAAGIAVLHGLPEAIVAAVLVALVARGVQYSRNRG